MEAGRIRVVRRFVSHEDEARFFRAADLVWLGYDRFDFMSGVVVRAAQTHTAVIYNQRGLIAHFAGKYGREIAVTDRCAMLCDSLPAGMTIRKFDSRRTLPDHSWSTMKQLLVHPDHVRN
jgi:hypothetical protein